MIRDILKLILEIYVFIIAIVFTICLWLAAYWGSEINIGDYPNPPYIHFSNKGYNNSSQT